MAVNVFRGDCRYGVPLCGEFDFVFADPPFDVSETNVASIRDRLAAGAVRVRP